ncbi:hypothetical protein QMA02_24105 [Bacillus wiedmannii]|uniref:hypothetical protein n=1 Tax=Bacillus wiedmannii TaxID=1890302 RepID=UPI0024ADB511|nr:hypothetical protein [Bacillus wiedmannii]MDI6678891.1 hypothetical protein [Bacillus wiedmannii]
MSNEIKVFDYRQLNGSTAEFLRKKENNMREIVSKAYTDLGRELKEAQDELSKHGYGCFVEWYKSLGYKNDKVYDLINRYNLIFGNSEKRELLEDLPVSLTYRIAKPSAESTESKRQAKQAVLSGEVKTLKEYGELEKALRQANEDKQILGQLLTEERNKQPEVEYVKDNESVEQLRLYRERYGDISENVYRITNETEISGMVMEFSEHTRDFIKQYAFLKHYEGEFHVLNRRSKAEYESTLNALRDFLNDVQRVVEYSKTSTFQSCI